MYLPEVRFFVHLPGLLLHHVEELGKVNCPISIHIDLEHQVEELVLGGVLAHGSHHVQQLLRGNRPAPVLQRITVDKSQTDLGIRNAEFGSIHKEQKTRVLVSNQFVRQNK